MAGSVLRGAELARGEAFFVLPADMPGIGSGIFASLLAGRDPARPGETLFAACHGAAGHPVLIPRSLLLALRELSPGHRLRDFLMSGTHRLVETGDASVLADLDTEADYLAATGDRAVSPGPESAGP